jgi:hypothetical protein
MVNNVKNNIKIIANNETVERIDEMLKRTNNLKMDDTKSFAEIFFDNIELTNEGYPTIEWCDQNMGAKWFYTENYVDSGEWNIQSGGHPLKEFCIHLFKLAYETDKDVIIENTYENESLAPIGVIVVKNDMEGKPSYWQEEDFDFDGYIDEDEVEDYESAVDEMEQNKMDIFLSLKDTCYQAIDDWGDGEYVFEDENQDYNDEE